MYSYNNTNSQKYTKSHVNNDSAPAQGPGALPGREEDSAPGSGGLSTYHISPAGFANFYIGGSLVKFSKPKVTSEPKEPGIRGKAGFSAGSRRRLMRKLGMIKRSAIPVFVTLTYPAVYSSDPVRWKRDFDVFCKRLQRRFEKIALVWKLEFQKRGAPHYHLMVWGADYANLLAFCSSAWYQVVGSLDEKHFRAGVRVEKIRSIRGVFSYASKYLGKTEQVIQGVGRFWGVRGEENIPWADLVQVAVTYPEAVKLIRFLRRAIHVKGHNYPSLSGIVDASFWFERLNRLI